MPDGRELRHVETAFGDGDLRGVRLHTGNRAQQLDELGVRRELELDPLVEAVDRDIEAPPRRSPAAFAARRAADTPTTTPHTTIATAAPEVAASPA